MDYEYSFLDYESDYDQFVDKDGVFMYTVISIMPILHIRIKLVSAVVFSFSQAIQNKNFIPVVSLLDDVYLCVPVKLKFSLFQKALYSAECLFIYH